MRRAGVTLLSILLSLGALAASAKPPLRILDRNAQGEIGDDHAVRVALSHTGRFVAFNSAADNLVDRPPTELAHIYIRDRRRAVTRLVSVNSAGGRANRDSNRVDISADGRKVLFTSFATNLFKNDTNEWEDVFVRNLRTGKTHLVSRKPNGEQFPRGIGWNRVSISGNGRYAAFVAGKGDRAGVWVRDLRRSRSFFVDAGIEPALDFDGSKVAFVQLRYVPSEGVGFDQIVVHNLRTGRQRVASRSDDGALGNRHSARPQLSASGRFVTFASSATNLVRPTGPWHLDVYWHDMKRRDIRRVGVGNVDVPPEGQDDDPRISADGKRVAFWSSDNFEWTLGESGVFVRLVDRRRTIRLDEGLGSGDVDISGDGGYAAFSMLHVYGRPLPE